MGLDWIGWESVHKVRTIVISMHHLGDHAERVESFTAGAAAADGMYVYCSTLCSGQVPYPALGFFLPPSLNLFSLLSSFVELVPSEGGD